MEGVEVQVRIGELPPPRVGNLAFFANLACIFFDNEELTDELRAMVAGLETYGCRLYPVLGLLWEGGETILAVECEPLTELQDYFGSELGLRLPELATFHPQEGVVPELRERVCAMENGILDGFVIDEQLSWVAQQCGLSLAGTVAGSKRGNNKLLMHDYFVERGELVFDTVLAATPAEVAGAAAELVGCGYTSGVAKSQVGASGIGMTRFELHTPPEIPVCHFHDGPCLVQGWLDASVEDIRQIASPSVQIFVGSGRVTLYDLTDQILSPDSVHEGNLAPPVSLQSEEVRNECLRLGALAACWLHEQGYRGTASADFHVAFRETGAVEVRVCELNARVTGATYPSVLARHFHPGGGWIMRNLSLPEPRPAGQLMDDLARPGFLYRPGSDFGVLPINFNYGPSGEVTKGQFLFVGDDLYCVDRLLREVLAVEDLRFTRD